LSRQDAALASLLWQNIARYREQLATDLSDSERRFAERCLAEEKAMLKRLIGGPES
jgi:hypothetical protein